MVFHINVILKSFIRTPSWAIKTKNVENIPLEKIACIAKYLRSYAEAKLKIGDPDLNESIDILVPTGLSWHHAAKGALFCNSKWKLISGFPCCPGPFYGVLRIEILERDLSFLDLGVPRAARTSIWRRPTACRALCLADSLLAVPGNTENGTARDGTVRL